jgi:hypothetical protein
MPTAVAAGTTRDKEHGAANIASLSSSLILRLLIRGGQLVVDIVESARPKPLPPI